MRRNDRDPAVRGPASGHVLMHANGAEDGPALAAYDVCGDMIHRLANGSAAQQGVRICIHTLTHAYLSFVHVIADS